MLARFPEPDALGSRTKWATRANRITPAHIAPWTTRTDRAVGVAFCSVVELRTLSVISGSQVYPGNQVNL
jgi:hypothetical protein